MKFLDFFKGYKTKVAGVGLLVLAISELLDEKYEQALEHILEGVGLLGISFKIERSQS